MLQIFAGSSNISSSSSSSKNNCTFRDIPAITFAVIAVIVAVLSIASSQVEAFGVSHKQQHQVMTKSMPSPTATIGLSSSSTTTTKPESAGNNANANVGNKRRKTSSPTSLFSTSRSTSAGSISSSGAGSSSSTTTTTALKMSSPFDDSGMENYGGYGGGGNDSGAFEVPSASSSDGNAEDETSEVRVEPGTHDELMYTLGVNLARQLGDVRPLVQSGEELAQVAKGLLDTVVGRLNDDGQRLLLSRRGKELDGLIVERANTLREKLESRGREMLTNMQNTEGVVTLDTGVAVHVLEKGENSPGTRPTQGSVVLIHYHGTLSDGTVFDSTLGGDPVKFPLAQVIPGWRDGVLQMEQGDTAMLGIPPEQAYGPEGTPDGRIPGGSTLFFKIQLVEVLSSGVGGDPTLLGSDGQKLGDGGDGPGLVGADGRPL
mmetsp:Transcript_46811/g.114130  ORF Transcript_46811/g.114130 Transcript_46811/m.114130 type:complete len:431 (-) Transcript_46811:181-1473(-)